MWNKLEENVIGLLQQCVDESLSICALHLHPSSRHHHSGWDSEEELSLSPHTPSVENETWGQILHHHQHGAGSDCGLPPDLVPCTAQCVQWRAETGLGNSSRLAASWSFRILWSQSQILPLQILKIKLKLTPDEFLKSHDPNVLIYNRIPKTGSSSMLHMIWNLKVS